MSNTETKQFYQEIKHGQFIFVVNPESVARRVVAEYYEIAPGEIDDQTLDFWIDVVQEVYDKCLTANSKPNDVPRFILDTLRNPTATNEMFDTIFPSKPLMCDSTAGDSVKIPPTSQTFVLETDSHPELSGVVSPQNPATESM